MNINVGYDFDEPIYPWNDLAHTASIKGGLCKRGTPRPVSWAPYEEYGCTAEEWYAVIDNEILHGDMYLQPINRRLVEEMRRFYNRGYNIHIITSRGNFGPLGEQIKQITKSGLIRDGVPYTTLNFTKDKVPVALELGLDYMVDDHPKYHDPLTAAGINSFLLDAPYNQEHPEKWHPHGNRVKDVFQYMKIIMDNHGRPGDMTPAQKAHVQPSTL